MIFENGTVVWVKLKGSVGHWWVGQVTNDFPLDLLDGNRTEPLAVVKFFSDENEFELVKKEAEILVYNCPKKLELIRKGKNNHKKNQTLLRKFIEDCKEAERLTAGSPDLIDSVDSSSTPKKPPEYAGLFKPASPPQKSAHEIAGLVKLNFKKPGSPSKKPPTPQLVEGRKFTCDHCSFTSDRLNVLTSHRKTHTGSGTSTLKNKTPSPVKSPVKTTTSVHKPVAPSPKKPLSPTKSPAIRGKKRKSNPVEGTTSAADKQDILADWSDAEVVSPESPSSSDDRQPKKPRTDQELSDAFESLLKTTKPPEVGDAEIEIETSDAEVVISHDSDDQDVIASPIEIELDSKEAVDELTATFFEPDGVAHSPKVIFDIKETPNESEKTEIQEDQNVCENELIEGTTNVHSTVALEVSVLEESNPEKSADTACATELEPKPDSPTAAAISLDETCLKSTNEEELKEDPVVQSTVVGTTVDTVPDCESVILITEPDHNDSQDICDTDNVQQFENEVNATISNCEPVIFITETDQNSSQEDTGDIDDAEQLENEVNALLAATAPVQINDELLAARPDLQYKLSPVQLKSEQIVPASSSVSTPPKLSPVTQVEPNSDDSMSSVADIVVPPRTVARPITTAEALKANSAGELILQQGGTGILRMTKPASPHLIQEKIVILPPDSSAGLMKSAAPGLQIQLQQQKSAFQTQQTVKILGSSGSMPTQPVPTIITSAQTTTAVKKVRATKQTFGQGQIPSLTTGQISSPVLKVQAPVLQTVQSLQTKPHALLSTPVATTVRSAGTGMVRVATSSTPKQYPQRTAAPAILTKPVLRAQAPLSVATSVLPVQTTSTVLGSSATPVEGNQVNVISQPSSFPPKPQQQIILTESSPTRVEGLPMTPQAVAITSTRKRAPATKRAVPGPPIFKVPEVKPKPTAAVKPTVSDDEQSNNTDAKIRQALQAGQKMEKLLTAEKVVHLLPIDNPDGTVTYMLVQMDDSGTGLRIDQAEGAKMQGDVSPIYVDSDVPADKFLATIIHQNSAAQAAPKKVINRKSPVPKGTPVAPRAKVPTPSQQSVVTGNKLQAQAKPPLQLGHPRQIVIGQQQQLQQQFIQIQPSNPRQPTVVTQPIHASGSTATASYQVLSKPTTVSQQSAERQVFVTQQQQPHLIQAQQQTVMSNAVVQKSPATISNVGVTERQTVNFQQQVTQPVLKTVTVPMETSPVQSQQQMNVQDISQSQVVQMLPIEEPQMPALIETKGMDTASIVQGQHELQQVHYVYQPQAGELGDIQELNMEIPLEGQDYVQVVTGEDGNQYFITAEEVVGADPSNTAYFQIALEGENVYDYSALQGEQYYFVQEDGTYISPQALGVDLVQAMTQAQQLSVEQQEGQLEEGIIQAETTEEQQPQLNM